MKKHIITDTEYEEIKIAIKKNKDKDIDRRLQVLRLRYEGLKDREIGEKVGYNRQVVSALCAEFKRDGLKRYAMKKYPGNHRNMSFEEEENLLESFKKTAEAGQVVTTAEIKAAYEKKVGHSIGNGHIYVILKRHDWRKVMPRSRHPKKASEEVIETSKKLKQNTKN